MKKLLKNKAVKVLIIIVVAASLHVTGYLRGYNDGKLDPSVAPVETTSKEERKQNVTSTLSFGNDSIKFDSSGAIVIGEISNTGSSPENGTIVLSVYDADGKLLGTGEGVTPLVNAGEKRSVTIAAIGNFEKYNNYKVDIDPI